MATVESQSPSTSATTNSAAAPLPALRRNGKLPSCEPCRKLKYSCDHSMPVCKRCQKRGIVSQCVYHPSPMRGMTSTSRKKGVDRLDLASVSKKRTGSPVLDSRHSLASPSRRSRIKPTQAATKATIAVPQAQLGYLGPTSYSAVFSESPNPEVDPRDNFGTSMAGISKSPSVSRIQTVEQGVELLDLLNDMVYLTPLALKWHAKHGKLCLVGPFVLACIKSINEEICDKGSLRSDRAMKSAAEFLFRNTARPPDIPRDCTATKFRQLYTGLNLRWEVLGIFFTACGSSCLFLNRDNPLFDFIGHREDDRQKLIHRLLDASSTCATFCEDSSQVSDLAMWLMHEQCVLMSQVLGHTHHLVWRRVGDISTAIFAQGLHQDPKDMENVPFWLLEMRRRALGVAYSIDKLISTFLGRPPRISQRYCSIHIPLDIDYDVLMGEDEELEWAIARLDENGWNDEGNMRNFVYQRCFVMVAQLREEVLELCLGPPQVKLLEKAQDVIQRNRQIQSSLPGHVRYSPELWDRHEPDECYLAAQQYLDIEYNQFMLNRLLFSKYRTNSGDLIAVAQNMMDTILDCVTIRTSRLTNEAHLSWLIDLYGLPAAGVLALELLHQKAQQAVPNFRFPIPKIIRDLSVFVSSLKWAHSPSDGNYQLAQQARKALEHILDRVLSSNPLQLSNRQQLSVVCLDESIDEDTSAMTSLAWLDDALFDTDFWTALPDFLLPSSDP